MRLDIKELVKNTACEGCSETLTYIAFSMSYRVRIRANNAIERLNREIRCPTRVVGTFADGKSLLSQLVFRYKSLVQYVL